MALFRVVILDLDENGAPHQKNNFYHHKRHQKGGIYMGMENSYNKVCSYNFKNIHTGVNLTPPQSPEGLMETYSHWNWSCAWSPFSMERNEEWSWKSWNVHTAPPVPFFHTASIFVHTLYFGIPSIFCVFSKYCSYPLLYTVFLENALERRLLIGPSKALHAASETMHRRALQNCGSESEQMWQK